MKKMILSVCGSRGQKKRTLIPSFHLFHLCSLHLSPSTVMVIQFGPHDEHEILPPFFCLLQLSTIPVSSFTYHIVKIIYYLIIFFFERNDFFFFIMPSIKKNKFQFFFIILIWKPIIDLKKEINLKSILVCKKNLKISYFFQNV